jgi:hypothetical protein
MNYIPGLKGPVVGDDMKPVLVGWFGVAAAVVVAVAAAACRSVADSAAGAVRAADGHSRQSGRVGLAAGGAWRAGDRKTTRAPEKYLKQHFL